MTFRFSQHTPFTPINTLPEIVNVKWSVDKRRIYGILPSSLDNTSCNTRPDAPTFGTLNMLNILLSVPN